MGKREKVEKSTVFEEEKTIEFVAAKTTKIYCNKTFNLIEGQKLPVDFPKEFIKSLLNIKIIKEV